MKKQFLLFLIALVSAISSFAIGPIQGPNTNCVIGLGGGYTLGLGDSTLGGTWSSSNPAVLAVTASGESASRAYVYLDGLAMGTATVTYTVGGSYVTHDVAVGNYTGTIVSGSTHLCIGDTTTLVNSVPGGTWTSDNIHVADASFGYSGLINAYADGVVNIGYLCNGLCVTSYPLTVGVGADAIVGSSTLCIGSTTPFTDPISGGVWSSSDPSIAGISSGGIITGLASGIATISYHLLGTCGGTDATKVIAVTGAVTPDTIGYTTTSVNVGSIINFTDATPGGSWTSSDPAIAYINAATGAVTGVSPGYANITYSVCGSVGVTLNIHVTPLNGISGHVNIPIPVYGYFTVWLIKFDTATNMLTAVDSVVTMLSGVSSFYYQFTGLSTDSFRVKAAFNSTSTTSYYGFVPAYYSSSFYWNTANVIHHVSGTSDVNKDINVVMGIMTGGAGFIAGDVTTGANRGSSTSSPAEGMAVYLLNSTNQVMQMTHTDAAGHYSFSNLPIGRTYTVFPEALGYGTTAYSSISLTSAATYMSAANFIQHTVSKTITPITEGVSNIGSKEISVMAYPNPTNGELNIAWNADVNEKGTLIISDISGRELLNKSINIRQGSGSEQVDLSGFNNGIYFLSLRSGQINYITKIQVRY